MFFMQYVQADPPTNKSLASLVVQLMQFQEDNFIKGAAKTPAITRIPVRCFMDFKANGSLCHIMSTVYRFKSEQGWRRFDLSSPSRLDRNIEMFVAIERSLLQNKCISVPIIFAKSDIDKANIKEAKEIAKRHNAQWTENESEATHILYPLCDPLEEEYARPTMKRDKNIMFHWYYFPDSYDTWITTDMSLSDVPETPVTHPSTYVWRLTYNWLTETDQYNEWMNEEDYEVDEAGNKKVSEFVFILNLEASTIS